MTEQNDLLSDFVDQQQDNTEALEVLHLLIEQQENLEAEIINKEAELKELNKAFEVVSRVKIPEHLEKFGLTEITHNGKKVKVEQKIATKILVKNEVAAHTYLIDNGFADLIKNEIKLNFAKEDSEKADEFCRSLDKDGFGYKRKSSVHASTLKSFVKKRLEEDPNFPKDLFGVYEWSEAKIENR